MTLDTLFPALLDQFGNQAGPAGLVTRAEAGAIVSMEVFIEEQQVPPVRIALEKFGAAGNGAAAVFATNENMNEAARNFGSHFPKIGFAPCTSREFDFEVFTIIVVVFLQGFDEEIVHGEPDGAAPVGIAAKNTAGGFSRLVIDAADMVIDLDFVRVIEVITGEGANAIGRKEFSFVEHSAENALQLFAVG